jgi:hypothetical protein
MFSATVLFVELKATVALTALATGAAAVTVIETVAGEDVPAALAAVYWKLSFPLKPLAGV